MPEANSAAWRFPALVGLGWTRQRDTSSVLPDGTVPGRIIRHDRGGWTVRTETIDLLCGLRGRLRTTLRNEHGLAVGDWVYVTPRFEERTGSVEGVLERRSVLVRGASGDPSRAQVIAANVDTVFVCVPGDAKANPRRTERELTVVAASGASPVLVLTKSDLETDMSWVDQIARSVPVVAVDARTGEGVEQLDKWNVSGATLVVIGPSGAGKSTLANSFLGYARLKTGEVRESDGRGRHTTTWRELVVLPSGALLIDTPGIREVAPWSSDDEADGDMLGEVFDDVAELADQCRFTNCSHGTEPGCAIREALATGNLTDERYLGFVKLQAELDVQTQRRKSTPTPEVSVSTGKRRYPRSPPWNS